MTYAPLPMIPGPVSVPQSVRHALAQDYGSGDVEESFLGLYNATGHALAQCMGTQHPVVIMTGEGMLGLWAGLKSCLSQGQKVLAIATGVFGQGIGDMAASIGCNVRTLNYGFDSTIDAQALADIEAAIVEFKPHMITAVHCETPSGTLNPLQGIGELKKRYDIPLFYVDAVSSLGGTPVCMDAWNIDILLGGTQKCLSAPPNLSFLGVSPMAWEYIARVGYMGYDALAPWHSVHKDGLFPYTPYWHGMAALYTALQALHAEGMERVFARHTQVAQLCQRTLQELGCRLWPLPQAVASPTVTAAYIPQGFTWQQWNTALRQHGLVAGTSYGPMAGKVFRLGHMGSQAQVSLMEHTLCIVKRTLQAGA